MRYENALNYSRGLELFLFDSIVRYLLSPKPLSLCTLPEAVSALPWRMA